MHIWYFDEKTYKFIFVFVLSVGVLNVTAMTGLVIKKQSKIHLPPYGKHIVANAVHTFYNVKLEKE